MRHLALARRGKWRSNYRGWPPGAGARKRAMTKSVERSGRTCRRAILGLATMAALSAAPAVGKDMKLAQFRGYSASGTHQCGSEKGRSCVVTGSGFTNCNDASITLQTRDCCPTTPAGGKSSGFTLNYCITDRPL
jgi:hypothetical protein